MVGFWIPHARGRAREARPEFRLVGSGVRVLWSPGTVDGLTKPPGDRAYALRPRHLLPERAPWQGRDRSQVDLTSPKTPERRASGRYGRAGRPIEGIARPRVRSRESGPRETDSKATP